jgi:hypothetical protein
MKLKKFLTTTRKDIYYVSNIYNLIIISIMYPQSVMDYGYESYSYIFSSDTLLLASDTPLLASNTHFKNILKDKFMSLFGG